MIQNRIVLVAGGTGGHVFPACALGEELLSRGYNVSVFTDARGAKYTWNTKFDLHEIPSMYLRKSPIQLLKGIFNLIIGFFKARKLLRHLKPLAVVGFGGYTTLTPMMAAHFGSIPTMIHQSDALLGKANRILARYMNRIATSFPFTKRMDKSLKSKTVVTGLPLRKEIKPAPYKEPKDKMHVLITGGSQGAKFFGDIMPQAVSRLSPEHQARLVIAHQCRPEYLDEVRSQYGKTKCNFELQSFFKNMQDRYAKAHLIISRSGSSSVLEAATVGRPALFIPYPYAADDHQTANAQEAVSTGGALLIQQKDLTADQLAETLENFLDDPAALSQAAEKISKVVVPHGQKNLALALEELVNHQIKDIAA